MCVIFAAELIAGKYFENDGLQVFYHNEKG